MTFKGMGHRLDFDKLLLEVTKYAKSEPAKREILSIEPETEVETVRRQSILTDNLVKLLNERTLPIQAFPDIDRIIKKLDIRNSTLNVDELLKLKVTLRQSNSLKTFLLSLDNRFDLIKNISGGLGNFVEIMELLDKTIDDSGNILSTASKRLFQIRSHIRNLSNNIVDALGEFAKAHRSVFPENIVTERNGRYVVLAKPNFKQHFRGIVVGTSSSGQNLYVEPDFIVGKNNMLTELLGREREEISHILHEASNQLAEQRNDISKSFRTLIKIDKLHAIASISLSLGGTLPEISDTIDLRNARHPLLCISKKQTVPIDIKLRNGLVITGPNTGGKTVALKTIGILSLMFQSGFLIPVSEGSKIRVFGNVLADIGDEQSIEQNLSTFSAHISNISNILRNVDGNSLILLDELGAGTDPVEGSTLAIAIMEYLKGKKSKVVVTTHSTPVKLFAYKDSYYDVASVMFDEKTLKPMYRLIYGMIGKSYAIEIAKRYGIPDEVIQNAKLINSAEKLSEDIVASIEREKKSLKESREKLEQKEKELNKRCVSEINEFIESLKTKAEKGKISSKKAIEKAKQKILEVSKPNQNIKSGDTVKILNTGRIGRVISIDNQKHMLKLSVNGFKLDVGIPQVRLVNKKIQRKSTVSIPRPKSFFPELNLIGKRGDESIRLLEKFLDNARLSGIDKLTVIHGYGTGVLKSLVRNYLKTSPYVSSFRPGNANEGGDGVTMIELKD